MSGEPDEFSLIAQLFAPLAKSYPDAFGLTDDAAAMAVPPGRQLVLTMDAMVAGVHFFADDPPDLIARKLVRVNLSDLAAKGAQPFAIMLAASFPRDLKLDWAQSFAAGLAQDCTEFGLSLIGGDTTSTPGPFTAAITAFGTVDAGAMVLRSGAEAGDDIWVTGTIGDSALGLAVRKGGAALSDEHAAYVLDRYLLPAPRVGAASVLRRFASAAMDVSDGLLQDLGHLARCSGLAAEINVEAVPLSPAGRAAAALGHKALAGLLGGGDDYEVLCTVRADAAVDFAAECRAAGVAATCIGRMADGQGVRAADALGRPFQAAIHGWRHFSGAAHSGENQ